MGNDSMAEFFRRKLPPALSEGSLRRKNSVGLYSGPVAAILAWFLTAINTLSTCR